MQGRVGGRPELEGVASGVRGCEEGVAGPEAQAGDPGRPARPGGRDDARGACRRPSFTRARRGDGVGPSPPPSVRGVLVRRVGLGDGTRSERSGSHTPRRRRRERARAAAPSTPRDETDAHKRITPQNASPPPRDDKHSQKHRSAAGRPGGPARATRPASTTRTWSGTSRTAPSTCRTTPKSRRS